MGTRGAIARVKGDGFEGVYHHWDSYPEGLGETLKHLYQDHYGGDLDKMLRELIDQHPAGWSTINGCDFSLAPGFEEGFDGKGNQPKCYCHGDRHEDAQVIDQTNAADCGCEWVYAFNEKRHMITLSSYNDDGSKMIGMFGQGNPDAKWYIKDIANLS